MKTFAIFAKFWEPGRVKSRLANSVGSKIAAQLYFRFLHLSLQLGKGFEGQKTIGFTPFERRREFRALAPDWRLIPQIESDLGNRMKNFFDLLMNEDPNARERSELPKSQLEPSSTVDHFRFKNPGAAKLEKRLVLIGSDTPLLPRQIIDQAFWELEQKDIVLGPSMDGGYYLVGARNRTPEIFDGICWSTERVLDQTISQIKRKNYSYSILEPYRDVDHFDDLQWLVTQLARGDRTVSREREDLLGLCNFAIQQGFLRHETNRRRETENGQG